MWCTDIIIDGCISFSPHQILMADEDHLGIIGAKMFGANIINDPILKKFLLSE